jgi:hypothetical protein
MNNGAKDVNTTTIAAKISTQVMLMIVIRIKCILWDPYKVRFKINTLFIIYILNFQT